MLFNPYTMYQTVAEDFRSQRSAYTHIAMNGTIMNRRYENVMRNGAISLFSHSSINKMYTVIRSKVFIDVTDLDISARFENHFCDEYITEDTEEEIETVQDITDCPKDIPKLFVPE